MYDNHFFSCVEAFFSYIFHKAGLTFSFSLQDVHSLSAESFGIANNNDLLKTTFDQNCKWS